MSDEEDKDSKTEDPTDKKIGEAFEKGNVPFSKEVTTFGTLLAALLVGFFYVPTFGNELITLLRSMFANVSEWPLEQGSDASKVGYVVITELMRGLAPLIIPLAIFGLTASFSQNQPRMVLDRIQPKLNRISIPKGLTRMFGKQGFKELAKSIVKFSAGACAGIIVFYGQSDLVLSHLMIDATLIPSTLHKLSLQVLLSLVGAMMVIAAIDLVWTRQHWFEQLKMSPKEIKDEMKQSEGDPIFKQKSKSMAQDRARRRMIDSVDQATLVVANPTHFAIALRYDPAVDRAPIVLAKGQDLIALKIRERAETKEIPVIEDKPLARALYKQAQIDQEIPVEFYVPIAKLVRVLSDKKRLN